MGLHAAIIRHDNLVSSLCDPPFEKSWLRPWGHHHHDVVDDDDDDDVEDDDDVVDDGDDCDDGGGGYDGDDLYWRVGTTQLSGKIPSGTKRREGEVIKWTLAIVTAP